MRFWGPRVLGVVKRRWKDFTEIHCLKNGAESPSSGGFHYSTRSSAGRPEELGDRNADIFDRALKRTQRDRAAWLMGENDPLLETVTENLLDRLDDCKRSFPIALNLGGAFQHVNQLLQGRGGIEKMISIDMSEDMMRRSARHTATDEDKNAEPKKKSIEYINVIGDEEFLPLGEGSVDVVISSLGLHWVNDLPGAMTQCRMALKPDGLFLGAMLGGETLKELRIACTVAQLEREGGISPRISPLAQVRDAGNLLQRAGLALPTVDVDEYTVRYPCALDLIEHLRSMGEANAVRQRNPVLKRDTALAAAAVYESMFGDADGTIPATFQVIYMAGWRPAPTQQAPKRRGTATASFRDLQKVFPGEAGPKQP
ncbi:NADH dehydrogenase [ubiquinone] 1 alpha subcomplex assembly factor 5 [Marchantia polymorpha subsp. ruderalis]|uniref:Methyltransferase type 11 domain-containing protein n=2 Tax=Marchantia polymorpha TaxID=3197 RepID=A0AAF6B793_MARPO|nr:hypothetical protein MARPO_0125s0040 [Marchantia polymorpha]PTQ30411.1 hypothetical protein MARPO_0125s0040 [Marchantia polymorpha]BBN07876.1 hypothetical protein Mp_4g06950 [Marchantia polymorpha subsp. ruderalis]BBN07877.1 hypothetical protein Mp_4g06950 [Marchantia polymorpha subsp. ruderalis]|eukprot:PTQ30410.1 hypothetical protein MARPO_0125s0040 [Marchantia polymorpha]